MGNRKFNRKIKKPRSGANKKAGFLGIYLNNIFRTFSKIRHHTTKKAHSHLVSKINWYKKWHKTKYHKHVHVSILVIYILSVVFTAFILPNNTQAALTQTTKTLSSQADFENGIYEDDVEVTNTSGGEIKLSSMDSLSNSGNSAWQYKRAITVDNTGGSALTDYPVKLEYVEGGQVTPAGVWHFNESSGTRANDSSGNNAYGTLYNGAYFTSSGCKYGNCVYFDGTNDYINMGDHAALNITGNQTLSLWVNPTSLDLRRNPLNKAYGGEGTMTLEPSGSMSYYYGQNGGDGSPYQGFGSGTDTITAGQWNHVVLVRDLTNMKLIYYVNNVKVGETAATYSSATAGSLPFMIGNGYTTYFRGRIDEVGVYSSALAADQVASLYAGNDPQPVVNGLFDKANSNGSDIRFTDSDGASELDYYLENYGSNSMSAWAKIPFIPANTVKTIYIYYGNSSATSSSDQSSVIPITTTGGTKTIAGSSVVHRFTSSGTFTVSGSGTVEALVVAGGGGGGGRMGGGGGAGGLLYNASLPVSSQNYTVTVGGGGSGGYASARGTNGGNSSFSSLTAIGGGGGGYYYRITGLAGGSGGGGGGYNSTSVTTAGGAGTSGQGYAGGSSGGYSYKFNGGGGGGAGAVGQAGQSNRGGNGGIGKQYSITGAATYYAGGGGGGGYYSSPYCTATSAGGSGGGGAGNCLSSGNGTAGSANTGGGGGGAGYSSGTGGAGGSGVVIIAYNFRQAGTVDPTIILGSESAALSPNGTWQSSNDPENGAIDLVWNGGWGTPNGIEVDVNIPSNTSIVFSGRTSAFGGSSDNDWSEWQELGTTTPGSSTFNISNANMPDDSLLPIETNRYIQIKASLSSSDGVGNPIIEEIRVIYLADNFAPTNPNFVAGYRDDTKAETILNNEWSNTSSPYFEWTGAEDGVGESGISGYWVYFGTDETADPKTAGDWQTEEYFQANINDSNSGEIYYLAISTEDNAGNRYLNGSPNYFVKQTYKFDKTKPDDPSNISVNPFGWATVNNFDFTWTEGSDPLSNGDASGIAGYQYKNGEGDWSTTINDRFVNDVEAYQNGQNTFYVRSVDNAGNISDSPTQIYYYYNADAPLKPENVSVTPQSSEENSFSFGWELPSEYNGSIKKYFYSVNSLPSEQNSVQISVNNPPEGVTIDGSGHVVLSSIPAATQQGLNTFYVVAMDDTENINFNNYNQVQFECNTPAPGAPVGVEIFDTSNRDLQKYSVALSWEEPEFSGVGFAGYIIDRSDDNSSWTEVGSGTSTSYIDVGLESKIYYYRLKAKDNSNNVSAASSVVSIVPTGRYTSPPELTDGPTIEYKISSAKLSWLTDREASSFVEIGENANYGLTQGQFDFTKKHEVNLDNLKADTIYHYRVKYVDQDGNIGYSADATFKTEPAPRAANVAIYDIRLDSAVVTWNTTAPAQCSVLIGKGTNYSTTIENVSGGFTTAHTVRLSDLDHSSEYHFAVKIKDIDDNEVISDDYSFETLKYPVVSLVRLEPVPDQPVATMKITWGTNVPTSSIIEFTPDGGSTQETVKSKLITKHEIIIKGLLDNTFYNLRAVGRDQFGNQAKSDNQRFKTDYDTRPPKVSSVTSEAEITGYGTEAKGQIAVYWETDEPSTSQVEFAIGDVGSSYSNRTQEDASLTTSHVVIISDLKTSAPYHFRTVSRDESGNEGFSEDHTVLTGQASSSVLDIILKTLNSTIGWMFQGSVL